MDGLTWYADADGDSFGNATQSLEQCVQPTGFVVDATDCDDTNSGIYPGAVEYCDGTDTDCDGTLDEDDALDVRTWFADADGDSFGDTQTTDIDCNQPSGFVADATDCDDTNAGTYPGAAEYCDGADNDCDGTLDEDDALDVSTWYADSDSDGYGNASAADVDCYQPSGFVSDATDCDDSSGSTFPGADEYCDGTDTDCDGTLDEDDALDVLTWYTDGDGDSFGNAASTDVDCAQPSGFVADATDCDDNASGTWPGADEYCDGIDTDCDGVLDEDEALDVSTWYMDADGDSYGDASASDIDCDQPSGYLADGTDCNDGDADIRPGAPEICENGVIQDCDGNAARARAACLSGGLVFSTATARLIGASAGDYAGASVAIAGDVNGDGFDDLLIGGSTMVTYWLSASAAGAAWIVHGPVSGDIDLGSAQASFVGEASADEAGFSVAAAGDVNGDGFDDVWIGAPFNDHSASNGGAVYLVHGPMTGSLNLSSADARISGVNVHWFVGQSLSPSADVNGDGALDLVVGAPEANSGGSRTGVAWVLLGPITGDTTFSTTTAERFQGEDDYDYAGYAVAADGDLNGDGFDDLAIGAPGHDGTSSYDRNFGALYVVNGPITNGMNLSGADAERYSSYLSNGIGGSVAMAGDVDGDGYDDVLTGTNLTNVYSRGYLVPGPVSGTGYISNVGYAIRGATGDDATHSLSAAGDVDADGFADFVVGEPYADTCANNGGSAHLVFGPITSDVYLANSDPGVHEEFSCEAAGDSLGFSVAGGGDVDGDGYDDVLFGAYKNDAGGADAGAAYLVLGTSY
jgi:hypothetical protein